MSHQSTTNVPSSLEGPLGSNEITNHISCPAQKLPGESSTLVSQPSVSNSELLDTQEQQNHNRNNEPENTQLDSASYGADHEHVLKPSVSSSPPFTAEDVNQDGQEPVGNKAEIPPATEEAASRRCPSWKGRGGKTAKEGLGASPRSKRGRFYTGVDTTDRM